jgi:iron complex transport system permease protein
MIHGLPLRWTLALGAAASVLIAALAFGSADWDTALVLALRLPRVLAAAGVGALLALAGLVMCWGPRAGRRSAPWPPS